MRPLLGSNAIRRGLSWRTGLMESLYLRFGFLGYLNPFAHQQKRLCIYTWDEHTAPLDARHNGDNIHVTLAHILLEETPQLAQAPLLFYRSSRCISPMKEGVCTLESGTSADFTTYFNALSVAKWHRYTNAGSFYIHLEVRGGAFTYRQRHASGRDYEAVIVPDSEHHVEASATWQDLDIPLIEEEGDVLLGFSLDCIDEVEIRNACYFTDVPESSLNEVELALATTTFRKEAFITLNIERIRTQILESSEDIALHFHMYVVDNGRTLASEKLESPGISIIPNRNTGGSNGFAKGMGAALHGTPSASHVILMDDDVSVQPESIYRTYSLLRLLKPEYQDAFISGAMMSARNLNVRIEDLGAIGQRGFFKPLRPNARMNIVRNLVLSETFMPPEPDSTENIYAGWWYCCVPSTAIMRYGFPLPFFVRFDDVEYALRCHPRFITMNGICIWHEDFASRYNAAIERYQVTRNTLIGQMTTGVAPNIDFITEIAHNFRLEIEKFNYQDAALVLEGFEDALRGPALFLCQDFSEISYLAACESREKLVPFAQLRGTVLEELGIDIEDYDESSLNVCPPARSRIQRIAWQNGMERVYHSSYNGAINVHLKPLDKPYSIIGADGWDDYPRCTYGVDVIVALDLRWRFRHHAEA